MYNFKKYKIRLSFNLNTQVNNINKINSTNREIILKQQILQIILKIFKIIKS